MSLFITFEGPEGSGKSTQARLLTAQLQAQGRDVYHTREPGGTAIGDQIRAVLHDTKHTAMHPHTEILLYAASRAQHVHQVIRPRLARGSIVISDRYADSTFAYQGYGHGLDLSILRQITQFATGGLTPDLTFYLDIDPEAGLRRRRQDAAAGGELNRMDTHQIDFYRRVCHGYRQLMAAEPARWVALDATQPVKALSRQIETIVQEKLTRRANALKDFDE